MVDDSMPSSPRDFGPGDIEESWPGPGEGQPCTPGATPRGSCSDPTNLCVEWSPTSRSPESVSSCVRPCATALDCLATTPICAAVLFDQLGCVSATSALGEVATPSLRHGGTMSGCAAPYQAIPWFFGSLLFALDDDQLSCGLRCGTFADCVTAAPYCSMNVFTATPTGLCQARRADKGARCSQLSGLEMCDTSSTANMVCVDLGLNEADNMAPDVEHGVCLETCTPMDMSCGAHADPVLNGTCDFGFFTSATLGLCDDGCSAFPDNCQGTGSPPLSGETARGKRCLQFRGMGTADMPDNSLCIDVAQAGTLFPPWDFGIIAPAISCSDNASSCPDETTCIAADFPTGMSNVCVFGCNSQAASTGCSGHAGFPNCTSAFGGNLNAGVCSP